MRRFVMMFPFIIMAFVAGILMIVSAVCELRELEERATYEPIATPTVEPVVATLTMSQVINISVIAQPTPTPPVDTREVHYNEHDLSSKIIDEMASIFWADCNNDTEKKYYAAVVVNRMNHGAPFDTTLEGVLSAKGEFNHGRISDRNREKARRFLNIALTQFSDNMYAGLKIPSNAVYVSRDDATNKLVFYNIAWNEVYRLD